MIVTGSSQRRSTRRFASRLSPSLAKNVYPSYQHAKLLQQNHGTGTTVGHTKQARNVIQETKSFMKSSPVE